MHLLPSTTNPFGGVLPEPEALSPDPGVFGDQLRHSVEAWRAQDLRVVWLEIPIDRSQLIPVAVHVGFVFHHSGEDYLMLTFRLVEDAYIPAYASHYIGAGGVTVNERDELLVVAEQYRGREGPPRFKLPGGALREGEHLVDAVIREVLEETGVRTRFDALVCFRHWHGYRYGKSDIYFICRLHPLSHEITVQEEEIAACRWMPTREYLGAESVSPFNKQIVRAALESPGVVPVELEGYGTPDTHEFFMPQFGE